VRPQELLRILEADGWYKTGQKGSHMHLRHAVKPGLLVVPVHTGKEIGQRTTSQYSEEGWIEMTREYLVVYEKGASNWSSFSPDIPGCGSLGDTLEDTRTNMREAMESYLVERAKAEEPIPDASATSIDFSEFDPDHQTKQYVVEWLEVPLPQRDSSSTPAHAA
jgi:predicted RNA binding protein YcfA (HicA-like mRNA interferase family)/predicted RNase H-like HicB family nuclease